MDWQKAGYQTFQIMWSMNPYSDTTPPLQLRSFTSDSYMAIKERERKRDQRKKAASKHGETIRHTKARRESTSFDAVVNVLWSGAKLDDDACMSDTKSLQAVAQEDCRVRPDGRTQQNLPRPSAQPTGPVEIDCEGMTRCLDASTSNPSTPIALASTFPKPVILTELWVNPSHATDHEQSRPFAHEVDMVVSNDPETPIQELGSPLAHETALASPTSSHPTPTDSCDAGCNTEPYKQPMPDGDSASPRPVSPQSNTLPALPATTGPSSDEFALGKGSPDVQGYTCRHGYHGPHIYLARLDQADGIFEKRDPVPQALWTKDLDEYLLHLRNVAQLKWGDLVNYFPTMTPSAVKRRHKQLSETKETAQDANNQHFTQCEERSTAAYPPTSTSSRRKPNITKLYHAASGLRAACKPAKSPSSQRQRRKARRVKNTEVRRSMLPPGESPPERSSRCGRPVRHPFRHRPQEGYL